MKILTFLLLNDNANSLEAKVVEDCLRIVFPSEHCQLQTPSLRIILKESTVLIGRSICNC